MPEGMLPNRATFKGHRSFGTLEVQGVPTDKISLAAPILLELISNTSL
jgi:hypothetical protein